MAKQSAYYGDKHIGYIVSSGKSYRKVYYNNNSYLLKTYYSGSGYVNNYYTLNSAKISVTVSEYISAKFPIDYRKTWLRATKTKTTWGYTYTQSRAGLYIGTYSGYTNTTFSPPTRNVGVSVSIYTFNVVTLKSTATTSSKSVSNFNCTGSYTTLIHSCSTSSTSFFSKSSSSSTEGVMYPSSAVFSNQTNTNSSVSPWYKRSVSNIYNTVTYITTWKSTTITSSDSIFRPNSSNYPNTYYSITKTLSF